MVACVRTSLRRCLALHATLLALTARVVWLTDWQLHRVGER